MKIKKPLAANPITINSSGKIEIPNNPIIPFIEGDGIGSDITPAMQTVIDSAVTKAYQNNKKNCLDGNLCGGKINKSLRKRPVSS